MPKPRNNIARSLRVHRNKVVPSKRREYTLNWEVDLVDEVFDARIDSHFYEASRVEPRLWEERA